MPGAAALPQLIPGLRVARVSRCKCRTLGSSSISCQPAVSKTYLHYTIMPHVSKIGMVLGLLSWVQFEKTATKEPSYIIISMVFLENSLSK